MADREKTVVSGLWVKIYADDLLIGETDNRKTWLQTLAAMTAEDVANEHGRIFEPCPLCGARDSGKCGKAAGVPCEHPEAVRERNE